MTSNEGEQWEQDFQSLNLTDDDRSEAEKVKCTLFIGNVPYKVTWIALKEFFSQFGNVSFVKCLRHLVTGRNQGVAFVRFENIEAADRTRNASETELTFQGRILRVRDSKSNGGRKPVTSAPIHNLDEPNEDSKAMKDGDSDFSLLNDDCLIGILSFVQPLDRIRLERVNKTWRKCALMAAKRQKHLTVRKPTDKPFGTLPEIKISKLIRHCCANLVSLELSLVSNQVSKSTIETIASCCKKLEKLDLSGAISISNHGVTNISSNCPSLKWLKLDGCSRITEKGIWSVFHHCKHLEFLHCHGNTFSGKCFRSAPASLQELHLRNCLGLADEGVAHLSTQCPNIKVFDVSECQLKSMKPVTEFFKNCQSLEEVSIGSFCVLPSLPQEHVIKYLAKPQMVTKLMVDDTAMTDSDLLFVCSHCPNITQLDVSCNPLTDISVTQLAALSKLEVLHICHLFNITNSSLTELVQQGNLKRIRMQGCKKIQDELFEQMAECCLHLEELDIAGVYNATTRTLAAFARAGQGHEQGHQCCKLYIYAYNNSFLDNEVLDCPTGLSVCVIYRHLYSTHSKWVLEGDDEPHNIVINRQWQPEESEEENLNEQQALTQEHVSVPVVPADMIDLDGWDSDADDYGAGGDDFLMNDDPLELEYYDMS